VSDERRGLTADILVAGAGPAGLALALQAHAHGAAVRIIDRRPEATRPSRALILHARTLEVLHPLGVTQALLARADTAPAADRPHLPGGDRAGRRRARRRSARRRHQVVAGRDGLLFAFRLGERATWRLLVTRPAASGRLEPGSFGPSVSSPTCSS
jgi:2-polyprenyl-6-methoxyphenol hydroxylase-like FAD-dependent oxidoreductase